MKKAIIVIALASIVLSSLAFSGMSLFAKANYTYLPPPYISIKYPQAICNTSSPQLELSITYGVDNNEITRNAFYNLDSQGNVSIPLTNVSVKGSTSVANVKIQLPSLSDGYHTIDIFAVYKNSRSNYVWDSKETLTFVINTNSIGTTPSPSPTVPEFPIIAIMILMTTLVCTIVVSRKRILVISR
jgi:hypothetical protein